MAHHNFYDSLGLDRAKDAEALGAEIDQRLQSQTLNDATRDELQVARRILGEPGRRKVYDTRLDDPSAPTLDVRALRQIAASEPMPAQPMPAKPVPARDSVRESASETAGTTKIQPKAEPEADEPKTETISTSATSSTPDPAKPKQYFPDTDPNAETVNPAPGAYPAAGPFPGQGQYGYQGQHQGQYPGQAQYQGQYPGQAQYNYSAQPAPAGVEPAEKKKGASPWLIVVIVLLLLAIAAGGWWLWNNRGTEWNAAEQEMADTFPQIISEKDGQRGWLGMKCTSLPASNGEDARIRCADNDLGVSIMDFGNEANRDSRLPQGDTEIIGNNVCSARSYKMEGVTPPAYMIAPEGADSRYLLLVNGNDAESKRMYLNLCEKNRG